MRKTWLTVIVISASAVALDGSIVLGQAQPAYRMASNSWSSSAAVQGAALATPWSPKSEPSVADRMESVLAKNPLALAWSAMRERQNQPKQPMAAGAQSFQNAPISLNQPTRPATPERLVAAAELSEARGQIVQARDQFRQALTVSPNHVPARLGAARMEDRLGNLAQAEQLYRQVASLCPQNPTALNDLALCLARQNRFEESAALLQKTVEINPQKPLYRNNLATVLVELKRDNEALANLIAVHGPAIGNFNLGYLLTKSGRRAEAAQYFAAAVQIDPKLAQAQEALAALGQTVDGQPQVATTGGTGSQPPATPGYTSMRPQQGPIHRLPPANAAGQPLNR